MAGPAGAPLLVVYREKTPLPPRWAVWEGLSSAKLADLQKTLNKKSAPSSAQRDLFPGQGRAGLLPRTGPFGDLTVGSSQMTVKRSETQTGLGDRKQRALNKRSRDSLDR